MSDTEKTCPVCGEECYREEADVGVGVIYGPWHCPQCPDEDIYEKLGLKKAPELNERSDW